MKKTKILGIILVIVLIMQVLVACGPTAEITFPTESVDCVVGAKTVLKPKVVNGSTADIVWTSSDESVATVSGGKVVGKKVGQAVITATIGKSSSSVKINVTTNQLSYKDGTEIRMGVAHNSNSTTISFKDPTVVGDGLTLADGKTYHLGDLKPVWSELQNRLNVKLNNVYTGASSAQNEYLAWQKLNFAGVDVVVGNASDITVDGKNGKILDLNQYLPMMPNFYQFLQANPTVYMSLISDTSTGSIYYAPYFDGYDDIEKYFLMRTDWVEFLLNGPTFVTPVEATIDEWDSAKAQYTNYVNATATTKIEVESLTKDGTGTQKITKDYSKTGGKTAVDYINAAVESNKDAQGKVKGEVLVSALRNYIDTMYGETYAKRSDLFCGYDAAWDADELVALLRCVVSNSYGLTGENIQVTGLFPRAETLDRTSDLLSVISMFGVRGTESRMDYLHFDSTGHLVDARANSEFTEAIAKMNSIYDEGLIYQNFTTAKAAVPNMYRNNKGFMIYDYCQTQALYNNDKATLEKCPEFNLAPVMNPVAYWDDTADGKNNGSYFRFTESWRSVKTNGWCIPADVKNDPDKLAACLKMFDYMYSEEGNVLMSYGPTAWIEQKDGHNATTEYKGQQVPKMSQKALDELWLLAKGNYTNYARMYTGASLPIGFIKDQGFEYQCTTDGGKEGALKVGQAIAKGTLKHVSPTFTSNLWYMMAPTALPTSKEDDDILAKQTELVELFSKTKKKYNIWLDMMMVGYGGKLTGTTHLTNVPTDAAAFVAYLNEKGAKAYLEIQNDAWNAIRKYYEEELKF